VPRVPLLVAGETLGSIARADLAALRELLGREAAPARPAAWLRVHEEAVELAGPPEACTALLAPLNRALQAQGRVRGWRDETYALVRRHGEPPRALLERAAARFWGTLTFGAHANGYVADAQGRPTHLWIAQRSLTKPTDPGLLDNLVGGGVPHGQTPFEALVREGWEEAGLPAAHMRTARPHSVLEVARDIAEGWQHEHLHVFDLEVPAGLVPCNQDGEVGALHCLPVAEALAHAATGEMTVDAALATLDFALRHDLLAPAEAQGLAPVFNRLKLP
jgi:8-oxo-dGTP pyrophosphatase MutT (NUDIX family)